MSKKWIIYCEQKNNMLSKKDDRLIMFADCIEKIESGLFLIIENPSKNHKSQNCFLIYINDYPIVVPFNERESTIQLITLFPDRRYKL